MEATTNLTAVVQQAAGSNACAKCHRAALVVDASGATLCARHGTIFMTAPRFASGSGSSTQAGAGR